MTELYSVITCPACGHKAREAMPIDACQFFYDCKGVIGTGLMGRPMASRLIQGGHTVLAYNRTQSKAQPLVTEGARLCSRPWDLIEEAEAVVTMLSDAEATARLLGVEDMNGPSFAGTTVIQMATIAPSESNQLMGAVARKGGDYFECPVLGSIPEAESGNLISWSVPPRSSLRRGRTF